MSRKILAQQVTDPDQDIYICGPSAFTEQMISDLEEMGVARERIRFELFGPSAPKTASREEPLETAPVTFASSNKVVSWTPNSGTLLDLAESNGLSLPYSCRSGSCHACIQKVREGEVVYDVDLPRPPDSGHALLCCAKPKGAVVLEV